MNDEYCLALSTVGMCKSTFFPHLCFAIYVYKSYVQIRNVHSQDEQNEGGLFSTLNKMDKFCITIKLCL